MKTKLVRLLLLIPLLCGMAGGLATTARGQSSTDWGDAPAPYPTIANQNGARHTVVPGVFMGTRVDTENDGQPQAQAQGDDTLPVGGLDDEDGVTFTTLLSTGLVARVQIVASVNGFINAFLDYNGDGDWADTGEQIFVNTPVTAGANTLSFTIPGTARLGLTFARFRFTTNAPVPALSFTGLAANGEVEDYQVNIVGQFDFGDAPEGPPTGGPPFYPTTLAKGGARHQITPGFSLGTKIDAEVDGQPNATATGDDIIPSTSDDEDGVTFTSPLYVGQLATIDVFVTVPAGQNARLDAFLDLNGDGDWADAGEQIFSDQPVVAGVNSLSFTVPAGSTVGTTFARFRLSQNGKLGPNGSASDGEVEDYQVPIQAAPQLDWGDAPESQLAVGLYPTTSARNGARHTIVQGFFLGQRIDSEANGQPDATATGDDNNGPDEDGVTFTGAITPGTSATVDVVAAGVGSLPAYLNAWIDFNQNGDWADPGEQIFIAKQLVNGVNSLSFPVPAGAKSGNTFARFRYSRQSALPFDGPAPDGEVEDYRVSVLNDRDRCDLTCKGRDFWLTFPGAYAPDSDNPVRPKLCIMGPAGTTGTITIAALSYSSNFTIPASMTATINLPSAADLKDLNDGVTNKGIHVVASTEVGITGISQTDYSTDSYLALHSATLGTEYIVLSWRNVQSNAPPLNGSQFAVVACESNTTVSITPSVAAGSHAAGVAYNLVLQPGDTYQLRGTNDFDDLTGTIVTSDKPVAVFGGHRIANVATSNVWFGDYIVEQLLPVNAWGNNFYTAPLATRTGDTYRCLVSEDNTTVSINGAPFAPLNRGQHIQFSTTFGFNLSADKPVLLAQYARSADSDGNTNSDPFMCLVQATRHYSTSYMLCAPTNGFPTNYINIIAPTGSVGTVAVDGSLIGAAAFTTIGSGPYAYARRLVGPGGHTVTGGAGMAAYIYGWDVYESYGHPGCFFMGDVQPPSIICSGSTNITVNVGANCTASVPDLRQFIQADDNCSRQISITQTPPADTTIGPGNYIINVCAIDQSGNKACCQTPFTVIDPSPIILTCPSNMTATCTSSNGTRVFYNVTARQTCGSVPVTCVPPSGSVFPIGTTTVTCTATSSGGQIKNCTFLVTVGCSGTVTASLGSNNTNITISWTGSTGTLQTAPTPDGPWTDIQVSSNSYTATINVRSNAFFRVKHL